MPLLLVTGAGMMVALRPIEACLGIPREVARGLDDAGEMLLPPNR